MVLWHMAALAAFFVKGLCGFANTLVFTSTLAFGESNAAISPVELVLGYPSNALIAWQERRSIRLRICLPLCALVVSGSVPGMLMLKYVDVGFLKVIFGAAVVLIALEMLLRRPGKARKDSPVLMMALGLLSGMLCGLFGVGALLSAYLSRVTEDSRAFRANICVVFLVENTVRVISYGALGLLTGATLLQALQLFPTMLIGLALGTLCARKIPEGMAKKLVTVMLIISGAALILQNL